MHIVHIAAEMAPIIKVGGLGDVILGLSREQQNLGQKVEVILPKYNTLHLENIRDLTRSHRTFRSFFDGKAYENIVWTGIVEGIVVHLIDSSHPHKFFNREKIYGYDDDLERFLYFSRASMDYLVARKGQTPDVIHLHEWQTAVIAPLYKNHYKTHGFNKPKIVFNIHNMMYQGRCQTYHVDMVGLQGVNFLGADKMEDNVYEGILNLMKGAIVYSDFFITVSPTYSKEVCTHELGEGMENTVLQYKNKFKGILNGIDLQYWNSQTDRYLPVHYSSVRQQKITLKKTLRERCHLRENRNPMVGCITRIVPQKGTELIKHAINTIQELNGQFILLGNTFDHEIERQFSAIADQYNYSPDIHINIHYDEELAHLIFAACDIIIVPSIFEPCGLTQLIALRYGTIPIVRLTGGLADTIFDIQNSEAPLEKRNGFTFQEPTPEAFDNALRRAFDFYNNHSERWQELIIHVMRGNYGWKESAKQYVEIYKNLIDSFDLKKLNIKNNVMSS